MTSAPPIPPETTNQDGPPFWRDLLNTTMSYMKWGYGALLLSFIAYGAHLLLTTQSRRDVIYWSFFLLLALNVLIRVQTRGWGDWWNPTLRLMKPKTDLSQDDLEELVRLVKNVDPQNVRKPLKADLLIALDHLKQSALRR